MSLERTPVTDAGVPFSGSITGWISEDEASHIDAFLSGFTLDTGTQVTLHTGTQVTLHTGTGSNTSESY